MDKNLTSNYHFIKEIKFTGYDMVVILIENEYLDKLKYDDFIKNFVSKNARSYFVWIGSC